MKRRSRVTGTNALRRKLRRMPDEVVAALRTEVRRGLDEIEKDALGLVPVDEGDLAQSIEVKVSRDGLTGIVGPGARAAEIVRRKTGSAFGVSSSKVNLRRSTAEQLMQFFVGYWLEFGTKGSPENNVPPLAPRPFMSPAYDVNRRAIVRRISKAVDRVLERVAKGG